MKNIISIIFLLLQIKQSILQSVSTIYTDEKELTEYLFGNQNYHPNNRPSFKVDVFLNLRIKQLATVDEKTQTIVTSSYLFLQWNDPRFVFDLI